MQPTLPDLLAPNLNVVFVGINPSTYSVERGHYFARPSNKFWPCISQSVLTRAARRGLGVERLLPEHDTLLPRFGIGFTDVVKRPSARAAEVTPAEFAAGVEVLLTKLRRYRPRIACFHGVTSYRHVHRVLVGTRDAVALGLQNVSVGPTRIFVVPNPSGANAHFSRDEQTAWYDELARKRPA